MNGIRNKFLSIDNCHLDIPGERASKRTSEGTTSRRGWRLKDKAKAEEGDLYHLACIEILQTLEVIGGWGESACTLVSANKLFGRVHRIRISASLGWKLQCSW